MTMAVPVEEEAIVIWPPPPLDLLAHDGRQLGLPRCVGDLRVVRAGATRSDRAARDREGRPAKAHAI
jgi:hypothetical protein